MKPLLSILTSLFCTTSLLLADTVKIGGSDMLKPILTEHFTELAKEEEDTLQLNLDGSAIAIRQYLAGEIDAAFIAVQEESDIPSGAVSYPLGFQCTYVVVNSDLPLHQISLAQLRSIYATGSGGTISRWEEVGLSGNWASRAITPIAVRDNDSLAFELFQHIAMQDDPARTSVRFMKDEQSAWEAILANDSTIAVLPFMPPANVKAVSVSGGNNNNASLSFTPTVENIAAGNYPLALKYYVIFREEKRESLRPYLRSFYTDSLSEEMPRKGFVPLPRAERRSLILAIGSN